MTRRWISSRSDCADAAITGEAGDIVARAGGDVPEASCSGFEPASKLSFTTLILISAILQPNQSRGGEHIHQLN